MLLTYRGVSYEYTPPQVVYGPIYGAGKYRGVPVNFQTATAPAVEPPSADLTYRGVQYTRGEAQPAVTPARTMGERMRALVVKHVRSVRRREQSMLARMDESVGLTAADAANYESHIQGKLRHNFWTTYDRSQAAMS
jgi:hypothetical protein